MTLIELSRRLLLFSLTCLLSSDVSRIGGGIARVNAQSGGVAAGEYLLGLGVGDITGPVVETNMMGYASLAQTDTGLHMRQRSRAFIIADPNNPSDRVLLINADIAMGDTGIRRSILSELSTLYQGLYTSTNVALIGTHQHSGVGGYLENLLPQITSLGFVNASAQAIIQGSLLATQRAHANLKLGKLSVGNTSVVGANVNRSPSAYLANPEEERARYGGDQDKEFTLVKFEEEEGGEEGEGRGFLSFFAVHGTSLYENNTLVSTDNKGMAAFLYENFVEPDAMPGNTTFVAGFVQSNVGDTSPNTEGAFCESPGEPWDGLPCEFEHSTCGNRTQDCHGRGPGFRISDFESNRIIGSLQFDAARSLISSSSSSSSNTSTSTSQGGEGGEGGLTPIRGAVKSVHTYLNMSFHEFTLSNGSSARTCPPALGFSFAGGTTDGPGAFDFVQGDNTSDPQNPFWEIVKGFVTPFPTGEQQACHEPKPILLNTGFAHFPYEWSPSTVDIQLLRVGQFVVLVVPGELTTMAGRRLREAVRSSLISQGILGDDAYVVIAGPANTYGHYVTTREEYGVQRYEGASTLFGPFTLEAYIDKYTSLVSFLGDGVTGLPASDAAPPEQISKAISLQTPVIQDNPPLFKNFGDVLSDVRTNGAYSAGETVRAWFVGANPRNNLRLEGTFLSVEKRDSGSGAWTAVRSDSHPSTTYQWVRNDTIIGTSTVTISWTIESGTPAGTYRLRYFGDSKRLFGGAISAFEGASSGFSVS